MKWRTENSLSRSTLKFFILLVFIAPLLCFCSQPQQKKVTIGVVYPIEGLKDVFSGFKEGLAEQGYIEGKNLSFVLSDPTAGIQALEPKIKEMVEMNVDLLYSLTTPATLKVKKVLTETKSPIPAVFCPVSAPEKTGIVASLREPKGNMTGVKVGGFIPKQLEWLKKIAPNVKQVYAPYNPEDKAALNNVKELQMVAPEFGIELIIPEIYTDEDSKKAAKNIPPEVDAIICVPCGLITNNISAYVEAGIANKIPTVSMSLDRSEDGILIGYGFVNYDIGKQASRIAAQILQGIPPSSLPVETAKFLLTINLKTADAIDLEIPDEILLQADHILR